MNISRTPRTAKLSIFDAVIGPADPGVGTPRIAAAKVRATLSWRVPGRMRDSIMVLVALIALAVASEQL